MYSRCFFARATGQLVEQAFQHLEVEPPAPVEAKQQAVVGLREIQAPVEAREWRHLRRRGLRHLLARAGCGGPRLDPARHRAHPVRPGGHAGVGGTAAVLSAARAVPRPLWPDSGRTAPGRRSAASDRGVSGAGRAREQDCGSERGARLLAGLWERVNAEATRQGWRPTRSTPCWTSISPSMPKPWTTGWCRPR